MPKWGIEMTEGVISEWSIRAGEPVARGATIALIESDKIVNEVQAEFDTRFVRLIAQTGEPYPVGALLAVMGGAEATESEIDAFVAAFRPAGAAAEVAAAADAASGAASAGVAGAGGASAKSAAAGGSGQRAAGTVAAFSIPVDMRISPLARQRALALGINPTGIAGSGRLGRVTLQDVEQASRPAVAVGGGAAVSVTAQTDSLEQYYASPGAKRLALAHGVDLAGVRATGPRGRISRTDVARDAGIALGGSAVEIIRMSPTRKTIARQLTHSKSTIPHFYLRAEVQLDALQEIRNELKRKAGAAPSLNDYLIRATALALSEVPDVNIQVQGDEIHRFTDANIAVAVATDRGLITPVIRAAQKKSVRELAEALKPLVEKARTGRLRTQDIEGASFTVSNLGMFGVDQFDAIINPPQGAILAIGAARRRPIEREGHVAFGTLAWLSLSCDHRAIDGAVGGRFLAALRKLIESPRNL